MKPAQHGMGVAHWRTIDDVHYVARRREAEGQEVIVFKPYWHERRPITCRGRDAVAGDIPHHSRDAGVPERGECLRAVDQYARRVTLRLGGPGVDHRLHCVPCAHAVFNVLPLGIAADSNASFP